MAPNVNDMVLMLWLVLLALSAVASTAGAMPRPCAHVLVHHRVEAGPLGTLAVGEDARMVWTFVNAGPLEAREVRAWAPHWDAERFPSAPALSVELGSLGSRQSRSIDFVVTPQAVPKAGGSPGQQSPLSRGEQEIALQYVCGDGDGELREGRGAGELRERRGVGELREGRGAGAPEVAVLSELQRRRQTTSTLAPWLQFAMLAGCAVGLPFIAWSTLRSQGPEQRKKKT